jgi:hypothetical protein
MNIARYLLPALIVFSLPAMASQEDSDGDGLGDRFEQLLLERFAPELMLSARECDGLPAEFQPGKEAPVLLAKNGTVYGQVFPIDLRGRSGAFIEIHYYHLWNSDCGLNGHALDVEHVSALLSAESITAPVPEWDARYWYAAVHEDTICDASHAVRSSFAGSGSRGPSLSISSGKHASFLDRKLCGGGCGADDCREMKPVRISKLVNLGEPGAPMNETCWAQWPGWNLSSKMKTDFPEALLARLDSIEYPAVIPANGALPPIKGTIHAGSSTAEAVAATNNKTGAAVVSTGGAVGTSLDKSKRETGNFVERAARGFWKALSMGSREDRVEKEPQLEIDPDRR